MSSTATTRFLRRKDAGAYLKDKYGFCSHGVLAKLATIGGGPEYSYLGDIPVYEPEKLDEWALGKLSHPVRSTSERKVALRATAACPQEADHA